MVSFVFLPPHGSWEVLETYDEIMQQLEEWYVFDLPG
jgi:hypothetical protein